MSVRAALTVIFLVWSSVSACAPDPGELSPNEALKVFLTALDRSTHAPEQLQVAFEWIDRRSQAALRQRASLSASLAGRSIAPSDMLVQGRSSFSAYSVSSLRMRTRIDGEHATVTLLLEGRDNVEIPMVRQDGRWRVMLGLTPDSRE